MEVSYVLKKKKKWVVLFILFLVCTGTLFFFLHQTQAIDLSEPMQIPQNTRIQKEFAKIQRICQGNSQEECEKCLEEAGFTIIKTDVSGEDYLDNPAPLRAFWDRIQLQQNAGIGLVRIHQDGTFSYLYFSQVDSQRFCYTATDRTQEEVSIELHPVYDWDLTPQGSFFFQIYPSDVHYADYGRIKLQPTDPYMYDLVRKYIAPVGYAQNNLFTCDWAEDNWDELCFTDLLDFLYRLETGEKLDLSILSRSVNGTYLVPSGLFADTITSFFAIPPEQLQTQECYLHSEDVYLYADYSLNYGTKLDMIPSVIACHSNEDGTFTLTIAVACKERKTDELFRHEVTIRPLEDGKFQYVANHIAYLSEELPFNPSRLDQLENSI